MYTGREKTGKLDWPEQSRNGTKRDKTAKKVKSICRTWLWLFAPIEY